MTQKRDSKQIHVELKNLSGQAGLTLHNRLTMADHLLSDREWVTDVTQGGGDENIAIQRLEDDCFGDICGAMSLPQMLEVLKAVPQVETWKKNRFNLRKMYAEMMERKRATQPQRKENRERVSPDTEVPNTNTDLILVDRTEFKRLQTQVKELLAQNIRQEKQLRRYKKIINNFKQVIGTVEVEVA